MTRLCIRQGRTCKRCQRKNHSGLQRQLLHCVDVPSLRISLTRKSATFRTRENEIPAGGWLCLVLPFPSL